jgi:hypothetical protein
MSVLILKVTIAMFHCDEVNLASSAGSPALYLKDECRDESQID